MLALLAASQNKAGAADAPPVTYEVSKGDVGWQQEAVTAVLQSHQGYLWLGSFHGLARFDGVRFMVFNSGNTPGLVDGLITALWEDERGNLWIGHETGELTRYAEGRFVPVALGRDWPGGAIEAICQDVAQDIWLLNNSGTLSRVRDGALAHCPTNGVVSGGKPYLARGADNELWLVANGIAAVLRGVTPERFHFGDRPGEVYYEQVAPARDGGLWVLGGGRLREWRGGKWIKEVQGFPEEPGAVCAMMEIQSGQVMAGTFRHGLFLLRSGIAPLHFSHTNGLSQDWVRALCEDREGNLWVGTGGGLNALRPRRLTMLDAPDKWEGCGVLSLAFDREGAAWIGTEGAGLYRYLNGQWRTFGPEQGVSNLFVWSVLATRENQLLAGTWGGGLLAMRDLRFSTPPGLEQISAPVVSMFEGKEGELWIGTTAGLHRYEHGRVVWSAAKDRLILPDVRAVTEADDGTVWIGMSGGGLGRLTGSDLRQLRTADGTGSDFIISLCTDADGTLWYGTADNGLGRWRHGKFSQITSAQGLPSDVICHIVDDHLGFLWMSSHRGILRASKEELNRCADGKQTSVQCLVYGLSAGLPSLTCSGGFQPGASTAPDGRIWFPTAKGIAIVNPLEVTTNQVAPPVIIEALAADREALAIPQPERMSDTKVGVRPGKSRFEIHYTALSLTAPDKVRFRHRLLGLESDWLDVGTKRVAEYSYLKPGEYRFQVVACNNDNVWNEVGATLTFVVEPYFWQTGWFQGTCLAIGGSLAGAGIYWSARRRLRLRVEKLERQRAIERERARIARDIHDDLGASLTRINMLSQSARSELDPDHRATADVDSIYTTARELTRAMDEIVWAVNPRHDTLDSLVNYLGRYAQTFLNAAGLRCRLDVPLHLPPSPVTSEVRHNLFLTLKEALNNVVKHARATEVQISLSLDGPGFEIGIADNGRGFHFDESAAASAATGFGRMAGGNGLSNMRKRLEEIGGACRVKSQPGKGTRVELTVRLPARHPHFTQWNAS